MTNSVQFSSPILSCNLRVVNLVLASACALILIAHPVQAQTFSVLHGFTGQQDGGKPDAGVALDAAGNLYGTTTFGGDIHLYGCENIGCGTVFKMTHRNSGWVLTPLHAFTDMGDGAAPDAPVSFGPGGLLYGSTGLGGNGGCEYEFSGCGVVFTLQPHQTACTTPLCFWIENPIHQFSSMSDGLYPQGNLLFDQAGNVYGTAIPLFE